MTKRLWKENGTALKVIFETALSVMLTVNLKKDSSQHLLHAVGQRPC